MEENRNRHLRPRRNVEDITNPAAKAASQPQSAQPQPTASSPVAPAASVSAAPAPQQNTSPKPPVPQQNSQPTVPQQPQRAQQGTQKQQAAQRPVPVQRPSAPRQSAQQQSVPQQRAQQPQQSAPIRPQTAPQSQPAAQQPSRPAPVQRPSAVPQSTPVQSAQPRPAPAQRRQNVQPKKAEQSQVFDITSMQAPSDEENEKTRLTDAQPKADFKTPVRKEDDDDGKKPSAVGGVLKALIYMVSVILVSVFLAYFAIQFGNDIFAFVKSDEAVEVVIPENATVNDVADILGDSDVIKYPFLFKIYASLMDEDGVDEEGNSVFIPGTYEVSPMKNYMQLLAYFQAQSKPREVVWVTFPEGSTVEEMITVLVDDYGIASREEFKSAINDYDYELEFLEGLDELEGRYYRLEGYLFPDTYQFYTDSTAETVVYKMLTNFGDKLDYLSYGDTTYKDRLAELGMTLDEVVTLASIIEEEVKYPIDYDQVSSVFHNRLANPAKYPQLGSDATTVYAITMETGVRPETLGATELAFDSPYNTRKSSGLTPGAIANPGFEALYSAFYPADTNYYYFVADNNGYNLYAKTEAGHEKNKASIKNDQ